MRAWPINSARTRRYIESRDVTDSGVTRTVHKMHGLLFKFSQSGQIGVFSVSAVINHFIVALGSITLVSTGAHQRTFGSLCLLYSYYQLPVTVVCQL